MLPFIFEAFLTYNIIGSSIAVLYPSYGKVQQVCIGHQECYTPTNGVADIFPLTDAVEFVEAEIVLPDGKVKWVTAITLPPFKG